MFGRLSTKSTVMITIAVLLAVLAGHLIAAENASPITRAFMDSLHAPGFGVLSILFLAILRPLRPPARAYLEAAAITVVLGMIAEASQVLSSRDADLDDLFSDVFGVVAFLTAAISLDRAAFPRLGKIRRTLLGFGAMAMLIWALFPPAWFVYAGLAQNDRLPGLLTFEDRWQFLLYAPPTKGKFAVISAPDGWPVDGQVGSVELLDARESAFTIEPYADWTGFDAFSFIVASADNKDRWLNIRIHDQLHTHDYDDRFNRLLRVTPTPVRFRFSIKEVRKTPGGRIMDMSTVKEIILFVSDMNSVGTVLIDDFRLEIVTLDSTNSEYVD